jgi:hypothetical protein
MRSHYLVETEVNGACFVALMSKPRRNKSFLPLDDALFGVKQRKPVPHEFVLEAIASLSPETRSMFGCLAIYVREKIVLILRDKRDGAADNGVWLATTEEHHQSLRRDFPNMRSIRVLGKKVTGWQVLPADAPDFEKAALRACEFILAGDPRIGKVPGSRRASASGQKTAKSEASEDRQERETSRKLVSDLTTPATNESASASLHVVRDF